MAKAGARRVKQKPPPDVTAKLERAVSLHKQGKWKQAEPLYRKIVRQAPKNFIALHLLGVVALEKKEFDDAERLIGQAIEINPDYPEALNNLGNIMLEQGRFSEALDYYDRALEIKPDSVDALNNRGSAFLGLERYEEALESYDKALALRPDFVDAQYNRGNALNALGRWEDALACYDNALAVRPEYAEAYYNRGLVLTELDRIEDALASFDNALGKDRQFVNAHRRRGQALLALERWEEAVQNCARLLALVPDDIAGLHNLGLAQYRLGCSDQALATYDTIVTLQPDDVEALSDRGAVLTAMGRFAEALSACDAALALEPDYAEGLLNRGNVFRETDRLDEALGCYDQAISVDADFADAHINRGNVLKEQGLLDAALDSFARALAIDPDYPLALYNEGICRLLKGDWAEGWAKYEYRLSVLNMAGAREFSRPRWTGTEPLEGRTIRLHAEQGLGDTIQFSRYASMVAARGARVILEVQPPLKPLFEGVDGADQIIAKGETVPDHDFRCSLMSLPGLFETGQQSVPALDGSLRPDQAKVESWSRKLGDRSRPRIGLVWAGSAGNPNDRSRSIPLSGLLPMLSQNGDFFSLQLDLRPGDDAVLAENCSLRHLGNEISDFTDTAALLSLMDLVVTVDTSVCHLSGALGRPTWVMLPRSPDWRWMLDRDDSPWYPSMKLFRQSERGDWDSVVRRVCADLQQFCVDAR